MKHLLILSLLLLFVLVLITITDDTTENSQDYIELSKPGSESIVGDYEIEYIENKVQTSSTLVKEPPYQLTDYERWITECVVMGEMGGESYEGQMLVAQCILNAVLKEGVPPSQIRYDYQYIGWNGEATDSVKKAVSAVFDNGEKIVDEPILYMYAPLLCDSKWHESQRFIIEVDNVRFFAEWS